jgi:type IV secretory pathway TraG/TraD family ATPase VirD4
MQRDLQILISVVSKLLGWTLGLAVAGVFSIVLTPGIIVSFIRGRRFIWWEYARWVLTGGLLGVFVYELRNTGFHWRELYFLPILGAANLAGRGLSQIRTDSPWRWLAWTPRLTGNSFHVDVAGSQGMKLLRGSRLVHVTAAGSRKAEGEFIHWGGVSIPVADECQHFLIAGKTGSGKSQAISALLRTVAARRQAALIADPGGAYLSRFGDDDSLILNPFDDRDAGWSPFAEIEWAYDCQRLAKATIPDVEGEAQQWHFYAQTLFAEVLRALWEQGRHSIAELLRLVMSAETEELGRTLAGTAAAILTARGNERMLANTRVICSTYLNAWRYLSEGGSFSVREWTRQTARQEHTRWLYLVYRDDQMAMLRLLVTTWLDLALVETLSLPEQPLRRLWLVLDEWDSLGKVDSLRSGLTKLRKYGGAVVAGLQTMAQLRSTYGHDEAQVLLSCFSTKLILAAGDTETARYFEHELGTQELERLDRSRSRNFSWDNPLSGSQGTHEAWHRMTQSTVLASEISALPNLHGYLITMGNPIARITLQYIEMNVQTEPFIRARQRKAVSTSSSSESAPGS